VSVAVAHARAEIGAVADASVWSLDTGETTATLTEITRLEAQLEELKLRVVEHAGPEVVDAWTHATRQTRPTVRSAEHLATALTQRVHVREALAGGDVLTDQARVIVRALEELPEDLDPDLVVQAERHLVGAARHHDARALRILGRRLLEVIAPDQADAYKAALLAREEADAMLACKLSVREDDRVRPTGGSPSPPPTGRCSRPSSSPAPHPGATTAPPAWAEPCASSSSTAPTPPSS
jgi:hypothetical protein